MEHPPKHRHRSHDRARPQRGVTRHHTAGQKLTVFAIVLSAMLCFVVATGLATGRWLISGSRLVVLGSSGRADTDTIVVGGEDLQIQDDVDYSGLVLAEPEASNFLLTGADNGDCVDQGDPTVGKRSSERSDTIMIWRINPETDQLAVLSLPRDLWVKRPGGFNSRINSAYKPDNPQELIDTIELNFEVPIDHYIQVDFCAFRTIVDAVGGVGVPFDYPARDPASLLNIADTGCVTLDGNMALSYVRSRHYQFESPPGSGNWTTDGTSDFGRIARQQDFLRRMLVKVVDQGLYNPAIATSLIKTNSEYVVRDSELSVRRMLEFANSLQGLNADNVTTYRVESYSDTVGGAEIERPRIQTDNMQSILEVFRGEALLSDAPQQQAVAAETTEPGSDEASQAANDDSSSQDGSSGDDAEDSSEQAGETVVEVESNTLGVAPDPSVICP